MSKIAFMSLVDAKHKKDGISKKVTFLSLNEIREEELKILVAFRDYCDAHKLRYTLIGGTLLGAVRHRGFIPWDDDIDVGMPRPDYEKLINLYRANDTIHEYVLEDIYKVALNRATFIKLVSKSVEVQEKYNLNQGHLWIDITPIDGLPDSDFQTSVIYKKVAFKRKLLGMSYANSNEARTAFHRIVKKGLHYVDINHWIGKINMKSINKLAAKTAYASTKHVGVLTNGLYGPGERMPLDGYEKTVDVSFEGETFKAMSCWDSYLTGIYGDYMTLPPVEKRINHEMKAWRIESDTNSENISLSHD